MIFIFLTPVIILIAVIGVLVFNIINKNRNSTEVVELVPSTAVKTRVVNKHLLGNDAPTHDNEKRNMIYTTFIRKSPCMTCKINQMHESETRYHG